MRIPAHLQYQGPPTKERIAFLKANYHRDDRLFSEAPREEWWMIGKLFRLTERGWLQVNYDSDGIEIGSVIPDGYREWLRSLRS